MQFHVEHEEERGIEGDGGWNDLFEYHTDCAMNADHDPKRLVFNYKFIKSAYGS